MRSTLFHTLAALAILAPAAHAARPTAGSVTAERLKLPSGPGSVRGLADEPTVDPQYAQVKYQVPIEVPAGYGGLAPALALTYVGALGNGPLGIGWTLAQPEIRRSTRLGVPKFDDTDTFEISGIVSGRLVPISANEFRVEGMGQTVRVLRVSGGFEVDDGRGNHYKLGTTAASRQDRDATHTLAWHLEDQTNLMGEHVHCTYLHDAGQIYLAGMTWGPAGNYGVTFQYAARPDVVTSYREGFRVDTAQRLAMIHAMSFGTERRAYQLAYDATFSVSRLAGVTSTGLAGSGAWPALAFTYEAAQTPVIEPIQGVGSWRLNSNGTTLVDLDGDGAADLLQLASGSTSYLTNRNGAFGNLQPMTGNTQGIAAVQLHDLDGDGRAELVQDTGSGWAVYKFSTTQWVSQAASLPNGVWPGSVGLALKQPSTTRFADLNGDGLVDAIQWDNDNLKIHLATRTAIAAAYNVPKIAGTVVPTALGRFQDVNGDGLDDYLLVAPDRLDVYIGHGDGTFEAVNHVAWPFAGTISNPDDIELGDLDRDGLIDLMRIDQGNVRWFRGNPNGAFATTPVALTNPETLSSSVVVAIADTNGNGSQDVVWSSTSGMWRMDMAGTTTAGMLKEVDNGLGMATSFTYRSSHSLEVDDLNRGQPWTSNIPIAMPVIVHETTALGAGETTRDISYVARNPYWDATEQQFAGFLGTTVTTAGATTAETGSVLTTYNAGVGANRELRGKPLNVQVKDGTGRRLSLTANTWTTMAVSGLPDVPLLRAAIMTESQTQHEEGSIRHTDATFQYDALGRQIKKTDNGLTDITGDESVTLTTYADDATTWVRDRVCEQKVTDLAGTVASATQYLFGDNQTLQSLCTVGKGWPRATQKWLASGARWITTESATYDAHGNAITSVKSGVTRTTTYDANALYPVREQMTGTRVLAWTAIWDNVLGVMTSTTDPDGNTVHIGYDSLGRIASYSLGAQPPHEVIEYDWTDSYPKTTTWTFDGSLGAVTAKPASWSADSQWRQSVEVANGRGEVRYHAQRLADAQWIISDYRERDPNSRVVFAGRPVFSSVLELSSRPSAMAGDSLTYDPMGRLIEQQMPTGETRTYTYTAFDRTIQDANLAPVHGQLDGQGRPILTERTAGSTHEIVQATYDPASRLVQMTLANGTIVRSFTYDTLGRLVSSSDPDLGVRTLTWDDGDRLLGERNAAGQTIAYTYDTLGRLASRNVGKLSRFHYDNVRSGGSGTNLSGRLAWIEEPTGTLDVGYDALGHQSYARHQIDTHAAAVTTSFAASGLVLSRSYDDGLELDYSYDPAGRLVGIGDIWTLLAQTAAGEVLDERAANGTETTYQRDLLGQISRVTLRDRASRLLYDVTGTRDAANHLTALADSDGVGLDHTAAFTYDPFSRLTAATIGTGANQFGFTYQYDVLHDMTARTQTGPRSLGLFAGTYRYGESSHGPRQLTSIADASNTVTHTFNYDAAGREIAEDSHGMTYDAADRLLSVSGLTGSGKELHTYGGDGSRIKSVGNDGTVTYFFGEGVVERGGAREHDVTVGDRVVARISIPTSTGTGSGSGGLHVLAAGGFGGIALILVVVLGGRRRLPRWALAGSVSIVITACASGTGTKQQDLLATATVTYAHAGFGAGPLLFTDARGRVVEEHRFEPFGVVIDAANLSTYDLGELGKRIDVATKWSDHGARWLQPEIARWTSTDPPVEGPDAKFMAAPWQLHPYQYVDQNPVAFWDPDGRDDKNNPSNHLAPYATATASHGTFEVGAGLANGVTGDGIGVSVFHADLQAGTWTDPGGATTTGIHFQADAVKVVVPPNTAMSCVGVDFGFGNVDAGLYGTATDVTIGAEANAVDMAVTVGTSANYVRLGTAVGVGVEVRVHRGDANGDGVREYGGGIDIGPFEGDIRVDPNHVEMAVKAVVDPAGVASQTAAKAIMSSPKARAVVGSFLGLPL
jgi:RHS repeat-associated protein